MQRVELGCKYKVVASGCGVLPLCCIVDFIKMSQASRGRVEGRVRQVDDTGRNIIKLASGTAHQRKWTKLQPALSK
jgi:hypothetical protein